MRLVLMSLGKNTIWSVSLDLIKSSMKATVIKYLRDRHNEATVAGTRALAETGIPMTRTQSRAASIHESLCSNRISFTRRAACKVGAVGAAVDVVDAVGAADTVDIADLVDAADTADMADVLDAAEQSGGAWGYGKGPHVNS